jgi:hypothetical protein
MPLANAIQYARKRSQTITWTDEDGTAINLTGATLRAIKWDRNENETSVTGTLTLVTAASGIFTWAYSEYDVATAGTFMVQFIANYPGSLAELSYRTPWRVFESFNFPLVSASASPSISSSRSVSPSPSRSPSASVSPSASISA